MKSRDALDNARRHLALAGRQRNDTHVIKALNAVCHVPERIRRLVKAEAEAILLKEEKGA